MKIEREREGDRLRERKGNKLEEQQ
jgi:hypothetical protein